MTILEALRITTQGIKTWAENKFLNKDSITADDFGVYVQDTEPTDAVDGDIWVDTANDPSILQIDIPSRTSDLINDSGYITSAPVQSVNGQTGVVQITADSIGALQSYTETDPTVPSWAKASSKPTYTKSEVGLGNVDNVKQYSASNPPPYPVTSVNGKTGAVTISALPAVTTADNGKVLMVVNGAWQVVDLNMSIDTNGVVSI